MIPTVGLRLKFQSAFADLLPTCVTTQNPRPATSDNVKRENESKATEKAMITENLVLGTVNLSEDVVKEHSKIFGYQRETAVLTEWQKAVNNCAFDLAKQNPSLMYERGKLKDIAEEKARETYVFKKNSGSRSCKVQRESTPKRMKFNRDERREKIAELSTEIELLKRQITTKQKAISQASCMKDYQLCDKAHGEMRELFHEKGKLEKQLKEFQKKDTKSNWYYKLKGKTECSSKSHPTVPLPPKNAVGSVDIRNLFKPKKAQVSATSTAASTSTSSAGNNSDSRQTTATIIDLRVTDNTPAAIASSTASITEESRKLSDPCSTQLIEQAQRPQDESMAQIVEDRRQSESSAATAATVDIPVEITREHSKLESQRGVPDGPGNEESFLA